jgi:O-antigen/teichoic acid export membrane protein
MTRVRRSLLNYVFTLAVVVVTSVIGFICTPWLIRLLGGEKLGASRALVEWFGIIGLVESGLTTALYGEFAQAVATVEQERLHAVMRAGVRAYALVGAIMFVCGLAFAAVAGSVVRVAAGQGADLSCAVVVLALASLAYPLLTFRALLEARGRTYVAQFLHLVQALFSYVLALLLAYAGAGMTGQSVAIVAANVLGLGSLAMLHRQEIHAAWAAAPVEIQKAQRRIWQANFPAALWGLCSKAQLAGALLLVTAIFDATQGLNVNLSQRLLYVAAMPVMVVGVSTWALVSEVHHQRAGGAVGPLALLTALTSILGAAVLIPLVAINRPFVGFWVGADKYLGEGFSFLTAAELFLFALFHLWTLPLIGVGGLTRLTPILVAAMMAGLAAGVPLTRSLGAIGAVAAVVGVMLLALAVPIPLLLRKLLGISIGRLLTRVLTPWALAVLPALGLFLVIQWRGPDALVETIGWCALYVVAFGGLAWRLALSAEDRSVLLAIIRAPTRLLAATKE